MLRLPYLLLLVGLLTGCTGWLPVEPPSPSAGPKVIENPVRVWKADSTTVAGIRATIEHDSVRVWVDTATMVPLAMRDVAKVEEHTTRGTATLLIMIPVLIAGIMLVGLASSGML